MEEETTIYEEEGEFDRFGEELLSWETIERPAYHRGSFWYIGMGLGGGALLLYAVITGNFLFALIILMAALVMYLSSSGDSRTVRVTFTDLGMAIDGSFRYYRDIDRFWFVYEPPEVKNLYLDPKSDFSGHVRIHLGEQNPNVIRTVLGQFVHEDVTESEEPFIEIVGRILKI